MLDLQFVLSTSVVGGLAGWLIFGTLGAAAGQTPQIRRPEGANQSELVKYSGASERASETVSI